jgi:6-phospho-3-hexuloisomerase
MLRDQAAQALDDLRGVFERLPPDGAEPLVAAILGARRIALHGLGREGLQMRGFAMRLFHLGLDAHVVGDVSLPALGPGDLLVASCGPGRLDIVSAYLAVARRHGARTAVVTAQPAGETARRADLVVHLPAQTMADDRGGAVSVLPMGSLFEAAEMLFFELAVLVLRERRGETAGSHAERDRLAAVGRPARAIPSLDRGASARPAVPVDPALSACPRHPAADRRHGAARGAFRARG